MNPFTRYPRGGRVLLGQMRGGNCRHEYGLALQRLTGHSRCAYCELDLTGSFEHWLLMQVDHVVPRSAARSLGIPDRFVEDYANLVLACAGCNGLDNRHLVPGESREEWTEAEFFALRDEVFARRFAVVAAKRERERAFFAARPWETAITNDFGAKRGSPVG